MKSRLQTSLDRLLRLAASAPGPIGQTEAPLGLEARILAGWQSSRNARKRGLDVLAIFRPAALVALACALIAAAVNISAFFPASDPQEHFANCTLLASLDR